MPKQATHHVPILSYYQATLIDVNAVNDSQLLIPEWLIHWDAIRVCTQAHTDLH